MRRLLLLLLFPALLAAQDDPKTPAEIANFEATPDNQETSEYLQAIDREMPEMQVSFYGDSPQMRAMPLVVVSREQAFTPPRPCGPASRS